jgi:serine O-acetyltransferase
VSGRVTVEDRIKIIKAVVAAISAIRLIPHIFRFTISEKRALLDGDLQRWTSLFGPLNSKTALGRVVDFVYIMTYYPEYRSVFYFRHRYFGHAFGFLCRGLPDVAISAGKCGPGLFLQHGFGTLISADSIGENLTVGQQSSIGYAVNGVDRPTIGDNVIIGAGVRVLGRLHVGDNARLSANSLVIANVPPNCVVMGVPAKVIWQKPNEAPSPPPSAP